jgi:signal transduction histidine kinase
VKVTVIDECSLPIEVKVALYRIAQEALNNVAKHSGASQAEVLLHCSNIEVQLTISDNGRGFDRRQVPPDHLGLGIMRERAQTIDAQVDIESQPGEGTKITITWHQPQGGAAE